MKLPPLSGHLNLRRHLSQATRPDSVRSDRSASARLVSGWTMDLLRVIPLRQSRNPAHGGEAVQVTHHGGFDLAFSPDGRWMFYSRERAPNTSIWRMPVAGGEESMVISSAIGGHVFATQRRLYFTEQAHESSSCAIRVLDLATGEIKTLAVTDRLLRSRLGVSRDEKSIYFTQVDDDGMDLMLVADIR